MPGKDLAVVSVVIGWIMSIVSMVLLVILMGNEGIGPFYVIIMITLIIDFILLIGFLVLILAATRGT